MSTLPFKVKAVYEYTSPHEDDLHFPNGQIITVTEEEDADWYTGEYVDASGVKQEGIFPRNFVEKYEPTAPPRPTRAARPKKEVEPPPAASEPPSAPSIKNEPAPTEEPKPSIREVSKPASSIPSPTPPPASKAVASPPPAAQPAPKAAPTSPKPAAPPPVAEKPNVGSFKDRIAAFNKSTAPPPTPFKPGGLGQGGSSFIKKPFVAPPPSKDAFIAPPREQPQVKVYRRDEDPEIAEREIENQENAERAGLSSTANVGEDEDQPKPTSLKERIALLQKQQMEQAARHADAALKKEKPKRPAKKRSDSHNTTEGQEVPEGAAQEREEDHDAVGKNSLDSTRDEPTATRNPPRRKMSKGPAGLPAIPPRESFGDGNDADMSGAGDETEEHEELSTGRDDSDEKPRSRAPIPVMRAPAAPLKEPDVGEEEGAATGQEAEAGELDENEEEGEEEEEEEEEEEVDPEIRRKEEIRARMAKMSGGMGMMGMQGMFGPPSGMPMPGPAATIKKKKPTGSNEISHSGDQVTEDVSTPAARAPPVPMALPGMSRTRGPEEPSQDLEEEASESDEAPTTVPRKSNEYHDGERSKPAAPPRVPTSRSTNQSTLSNESLSAPPVPGGRPAPPPIPSESRPVPLGAPISLNTGSESDDDTSLHESTQTVKTPTAAPPVRELPPRPPVAPPSRQGDGPGGPKSPDGKRVSYFGTEASPTSPTAPGVPNRRVSRQPPIPGTTSSPSTQTRAPPPPPPTQSLSRSSTGDSRSLSSPKHTVQDESDEEITEYEGDYDTDIASAVPHRDALTAHANDSSENDAASLRSPVVSSPPPLPPVAAPRAVPPLPPASAPRAVPPPPPSQPPPTRQSTELRAAPPPPPKEQRYDEDEDDDEYDPYKYTAAKQSIPVGGVAIGRVPTNRTQSYEDDLYSASPPRGQPPPPQERAAPPPPPREPAPPASSRAPPPPRQSSEFQKPPTVVRRSTDLARMSHDSGFVANDVDLGQSSLWWKNSEGVPPVFEGRIDILHESEESTTTKRGGKSTTTKDLYVLFQDYSQTIIHARFDPHNPSDVVLEQRHEQPPPRLRQDQLEESYERFGRKISDAVASKKDSVVGDGSPQALITELLKPLNDALLPVGTRAYGALVYSNMANASTSQSDEIRPGDIITLRNAKLQGKHGPMHAKYSTEVGAGNGHVGVVAEWDGTKKKLRAWEQGRDSKKVKLESYKLDDLRSGEVKIWRVMPRSWVGWEGEN